MEKKQKKRELAWAAAFLVLTALLVQFAAKVLRPVFTVYGSTWQTFLAEPEDSLDVIYLGSSFMYCDVNPSLVYESSGLTGFVMAGSEQPLSITYWYLREALKTQSPSAVVLEATSLYFQPYQNYTQQNVALMPSGLNKLGAILTASEPDLRQGLLFDLSLYHDRWKEIGPGDVKRAVLPPQPDTYKGYTPMAGVLPGVGVTPYVQDRYIEAENYADNLVWLGKILDLCRDNGIQPILTIHPSYTRCTPEAYAGLEEDVKALSPDVIFRDWSDLFEPIGLIPDQHIYDGSHLNREGAAIFSEWLGRELTGDFGLSPRPQTAENAEAWQNSAAWWREELKKT